MSPDVSPVILGCSAVTLVSAVIAVFVGDMRRSILALWVAGLGAGGLFLSLGAELLAMIQWIVSTLMTVSFIFYAVMFGEYGKGDDRPLAKRALSAALPILLGGAFAGVVFVGASRIPGALEWGVPAPAINTDLAAVGQSLVTDHLLSLELMALALFLILIGAGVVARPGRPGSPDGDQP